MYTNPPMEVVDSNDHVLKVLEALKQASHELQTQPESNSDDSNSSPAINALLQLQTESDTFLSDDPKLQTLSHHLSSLKMLVDSLRRSPSGGGIGLRSFLRRRGSNNELSRLAESIQSEIQSWIDRESIETLTKTLRSPPLNEEECVSILTRFENRISQGFNRELQDLILKSKLFSDLESVLCNSSSSKKIREQAGYVINGLIRFNKDVFVGQVLMGPAIRALISMKSTASLCIISSLIKTIKSPIVDEIESNSQIPRIISFLSSDEIQIRVLAMDCVLEIGYFGRKEAIEAMVEQGLIEKLMELQRSEMDRAFASCVARFAVQLEVGEGLRQREKRAFKLEILRRVKEASGSEAESATIVAEVLWGSSP